MDKQHRNTQLLLPTGAVNKTTFIINIVCGKAQLSINNNGNINAMVVSIQML